MLRLLALLALGLAPAVRAQGYGDKADAEDPYGLDVHYGNKAPAGGNAATGYGAGDAATTAPGDYGPDTTPQAPPPVAPSGIRNHSPGGYGQMTTSQYGGQATPQYTRGSDQGSSLYAATTTSELPGPGTYGQGASSPIASDQEPPAPASSGGYGQVTTTTPQYGDAPADAATFGATAFTDDGAVPVIAPPPPPPVSLSAQRVSGQLLDDTSWTGGDGVETIYVTDTLTVFPHVTLTIKGRGPDAPPLKVRFAKDASINVYPTAKLVMEDVHMTSDAFRQGDGVKFVSSGERAEVEFTRVHCERMGSCIEGDGQKITVVDSVFRNNKAGLSGNGHGDASHVTRAENLVHVRNCTFILNTWGVLGAHWSFQDCRFTQNEYGSVAEETDFVRTTFEDNRVATQGTACKTCSATFHDVFFHRNAVGIGPGGDVGKLANVTFLDNTVAIKSDSALHGMTNVNFLRSTKYDLQFTGEQYLRLEGVFWGADAVVPKDVRPRIFDAYANSGHAGIIDVSSLSLAPHCHPLFPQELVEEVFDKDWCAPPPPEINLGMHEPEPIYRDYNDDPEHPSGEAADVGDEFKEGGEKEGEATDADADGVPDDTIPEDTDVDADASHPSAFGWPYVVFVMLLFGVGGLCCMQMWRRLCGRRGPLKSGRRR
mmetsp:Transcript_12127/g.36586  ORF Transcript_12127/g.36586 Transcript_12127/m.36586 type:complete len:655 (-) Transcript_12127:38-2002(-)